MNNNIKYSGLKIGDKFTTNNWSGTFTVTNIEKDYSTGSYLYHTGEFYGPFKSKDIIELQDSKEVKNPIRKKDFFTKLSKQDIIDAGWEVFEEVDRDHTVFTNAWDDSCIYMLAANWYDCSSAWGNSTDYIALEVVIKVSYNSNDSRTLYKGHIQTITDLKRIMDLIMQ